MEISNALRKLALNDLMLRLVSGSSPYVVTLTTNGGETAPKTIQFEASGAGAKVKTTGSVYFVIAKDTVVSAVNVTLDDNVYGVNGVILTYTLPSARTFTANGTFTVSEITVEITQGV